LPLLFAISHTDRISTIFLSKKQEMKKYKVGLVLGGGGTRGFAHLGIIKALNEKGIYPEVISGVSAGAIVGAFIASGKSPDEVFELMKAKSFFKYSSFQLPVNGLLSLNGLQKSLEDQIEADVMGELKTPLYVAAVNLNEGKIEYFNEGPLAKLVRASSSIPMLYSPVEYKGDLYVDGGLLDNLPIEPLKDQCEKIIAVNIMPIRRTEKLSSFKDIAIRTFDLGVNLNDPHKLEKCDLYLEPEEVTHFPILDTSKVEELFNIGYEYGKNLQFDSQDFISEKAEEVKI
jgi:NTE family protein